MEVASDTEQWITISEFPKYEVSSHGRVRNRKTGRVLKPMWTGLKRKQYATVRFGKGSSADRKVHHLVLEAFVGPRPPGGIARHLDDDATNNRADNLRWGSYGDNSADAVYNGAVWSLKVSPEDAERIAIRRRAGESGKALAAEFGVSQQTICDIYKGRRVAVGPRDLISKRRLPGDRYDDPT